MTAPTTPPAIAPTSGRVAGRVFRSAKPIVFGSELLALWIVKMLQISLEVAEGGGGAGLTYRPRKQTPPRGHNWSAWRQRTLGLNQCISLRYS